MPINFSEFHLLRPELLWLMIPALLTLYSVKHLAKKQSSWNNVISPHLLKFLMISAEKQRSHVSFWLTAIIAVLIIFAVSGPSFREKTVPVFETETSRVLLLDLSLSMDATDIKPSRVTRAKHKMMDFLKQTNEGTIGLVVYAGDAFVISPLTSDANTIASMVPTLSTGVMPVLGSRPDKGINKAIQLLDNAKQNKGQIIWITDGIDKEYIDSITDSLNSSNHFLSILAVGTEQGAPIPLPDNNGFLKDSLGNIILPRLDAKNLKEVARAINGQYVELTANSDDIEFIVNTLIEDDETSKSDERISKWIDDGYWISWFIILFMLVKLFRRTDGQLMSLPSVSMTQISLGLLLTSLLIPHHASAEVWEDLWKTKDQQASKAFNEKDFKKASELFENKEWQGAANYREGNFDEAALQFENSDIESVYNKANSLAKSKKFEKAIKEYQQVLNKKPEHEDALFNKKIVEELLKQQKEQEKQDQEKKDQQDKKDQDQKDQEQQQSDEQSDSESDSDEKSDENSEEKPDDEKKKEQDEKEQQEQSEKESKEKDQEAQISEDEREQNEKDQALEHWLEKIPDDPGGLLRRKMYREYQKRNRQQTEKKIW